MSMLTAREKQLLEAIKRHVSVKEAANSIGLSARTAYNMLLRIRKKYVKARRLVNIIINYRKSDGYLNKLLSIRQPLWKEVKELEEEQKLESKLAGELE